MADKKLTPEEEFAAAEEAASKKLQAERDAKFAEEKAAAAKAAAAGASSPTKSTAHLESDYTGPLSCDQALERIAKFGHSGAFREPAQKPAETKATK